MSETLESFHAVAGATVQRNFPAQGNLQVLQIGENDSVQAAVARYRASGLVQFAEPDYVISAAAVLPNDPRFQDGTQWWLNNFGQNGGVPDADVDAPEAWDVIRFASNIVVALVDTGVRYTHEDLITNLWKNPSDGTYGFNALTGSADPWDDNGHGTHLAGIIGAISDNGKGIAGVAWQVQIMACKALGADGRGFYSDAIECIEFARSNGAHILNFSWGGNDYSAAISNALWLAHADGIIVAAAAGNSDGRDTDITPYYPASIELDNIVAVGASTRTDNVWSLSNYGAKSVDLFAPGAAIYSTGNSSDSSYASRDGSSMASACVAGALALAREQFPDAPYRHYIERLLATVDRRPAFAGRCVSGGRLNLRKLLDQPSVTATSNIFPFEMRIVGVTGHQYVVSGATNLFTWTPLQTNFMNGNGEWIFVDQQSTNLPFRFYRVDPAP